MSLSVSMSWHVVNQNVNVSNQPVEVSRDTKLGWFWLRSSFLSIVCSSNLLERNFHIRVTQQQQQVNGNRLGSWERGKGEEGHGGLTFAEKLHNCFRSISADFGVRVGEGEPVEQELAQGTHLADLKETETKRRPSVRWVEMRKEGLSVG